MRQKNLSQLSHFLSLHPLFFLLVFQMAGIFLGDREYILLFVCPILLLAQKGHSVRLLALLCALFSFYYLQNQQQHIANNYIPIQARLELKEIQEVMKNFRLIYKLKSLATITENKKTIRIPVIHYLSDLKAYNPEKIYQGKLYRHAKSVFFIHNKKDVAISKKVHPSVKQFLKKTTLMHSITRHTKHPLLAHLYTHLLIAKTPIDSFVSDLFCCYGLSHILVISGFHFSLMLLLFFTVLKPLLPKKLLHLLLMCISLIFYSFIGRTPSMLRALICISFFLWANVQQKPMKPLNILSLAALVSLFVAPNYLHHLGFKLSFLATFGILVAKKPIELALQKVLKKRSYQEFIALTLWQKHLYLFQRLLVKGLSLHLAVFLITTPTILCYIKIVPLNSFIYNLTIPFFIGLILPPLMILLLLPCLSPYMLAFIDPIAKGMLDILYFAPSKFLPILSTNRVTTSIASLLTLLFSTFFILQYERK